MFLNYLVINFFYFCLGHLDSKYIQLMHYWGDFDISLYLYFLIIKKSCATALKIVNLEAWSFRHCNIFVVLSHCGNEIYFWNSSIFPPLVDGDPISYKALKSNKKAEFEETFSCLDSYFDRPYSFWEIGYIDILKFCVCCFL